MSGEYAYCIRCGLEADTSGDYRGQAELCPDCHEHVMGEPYPTRAPLPPKDTTE